MIVIIPLQNTTPTRQGLLGMCRSYTGLPAHWTPPHLLLTIFSLSPPLRLQGLEIIRSDSEAGEVEELHFSTDLTFHKALKTAARQLGEQFLHLWKSSPHNL